jgi:hypothetical protein
MLGQFGTAHFLKVSVQTDLKHTLSTSIVMWFLLTVANYLPKSIVSELAILFFKSGKTIIKWFVS